MCERTRDSRLQGDFAASIERLARERITEQPIYANCFRDISIEYTDGVLTVRGRLPSFYAKQVLQTLLRGLEGVKRIENLTEVVRSSSLEIRRFDPENGTVSLPHVRSVYSEM